VVLAVLWVSAFPEYFGAKDGITADGTPVGNLPYAAACFVVAALAALGVVRISRPRHSVEVAQTALR
jgi:hypothetical protein